MFLFLSIPILVTNLFAVIYALYMIKKNYSKDVHRPRLIAIIYLILADLPGSALFILPMITHPDVLNTPNFCSFYVTMSSFSILRILALTSLTLFYILLVFTSFDNSTLNKIGRILNAMAILGFIVFEVAIVPFGGAIPSDYRLGDVEKQFPQRCVIKLDIVNQVIVFSQIIVSLVMVALAIFATFANCIKYIFYRSTNSYKIAISFILFSIANLLVVIPKVLEEFFKIEFSQTTKYVLFDYGKLAPSIFSIIYLITEGLYKRSNHNYDIRKILE